MIKLHVYILAAAMTASVATGVFALQEQPGQPKNARKPFIKRSNTPRELLDFNKRLAKISRDLRVPGVAVAVVIADRLVYLQATGSRDAVKRLPVTPDTRFYIESCTKPFIAAAMVMLAEEGKIDLGAPVKKYLPRFELGNAVLTKALTVRELLCHARGIESAPINWLDSFTGEITEDRFYRWLKKDVPAQGHKYTHLHYALAGRIIEAVTHKSWKNFVQKRIFAPAGMSKATFHADAMYAGKDGAIPAVRRESGYAPSAVRKTDRTMNAAGGIGMSIRDLTRWLRLNMNGGEIDGTRVLSKSGTADMQRIHAEGGRQWPSFIRRSSDGHGLGWEIGTYLHRTLISHGSSFVGTTAHVSFMPEENIGVAVLANVDGACADVIAMSIYDRLLVPDPEDLLPRYRGSLANRIRNTLEFESLFAKNPTVGGGLSLPASAYVGTYANENWGTVKLWIKDGELVGSMGDLSLRFGSEGKDRFVVGYGLRRPDTGRFDTGPNGVRAILIDLTAGGAAVRYERR